MSEHICRNCRWWEGSGVAKAPPILDGHEWGECLLAESRDINCSDDVLKSPRHEEKHCCWNGLTTRDDFGCVQWEGKE